MLHDAAISSPEVRRTKNIFHLGWYAYDTDHHVHNISKYTCMSSRATYRVDRNISLSITGFGIYDFCLEIVHKTIAVIP